MFANTRAPPKCISPKLIRWEKGQDWCPGRSPGAVLSVNFFLHTFTVTVICVTSLCLSFYRPFLIIFTALSFTRLVYVRSLQSKMMMMMKTQ